MTTQVKICGITRIEDAFAAVDAGADMLGYNFYPKSSRCISPAACIEIQEALARSGRKITTVAVFVNESAERINGILAKCNIDYAQLSGDESPEALRQLEGCAFKGVRPRSAVEGEQLAARYANPLVQPNLLLDAYHPVQYGGTGQTMDFALAAQITALYSVLLAGGLTPENAADAVSRTRPWGLDVASGVESAPGKKDHIKIKRFVQAARSLST